MTAISASFAVKWAKREPRAAMRSERVVGQLPVSAVRALSRRFGAHEKAENVLRRTFRYVSTQ